MLWFVFFLLAAFSVMVAVFDDAEDGEGRMGWASWRALLLGVGSATAAAAVLPAGIGSGIALLLLAAGYASAWSEARPTVELRVGRFLDRLDRWAACPVSRALRIQERIDRAEAEGSPLSRVGVLGILPVWIGLTTPDPLSLFLGGVALSVPAAQVVRELSRRAEGRSLRSGLHERLEAPSDSPALRPSSNAAA